MTKKRFARLLMSMAYTRDEAAEQAALCRSMGLPYGEAFVRIYTPPEPDQPGEALLKRIEEKYGKGEPHRPGEESGPGISERSGGKGRLPDKKTER